MLHDAWWTPGNDPISNEFPREIAIIDIIKNINYDYYATTR